MKKGRVCKGTKLAFQAIDRWQSQREVSRLAHVLRGAPQPA